MNAPSCPHRARHRRRPPARAARSRWRWPRPAGRWPCTTAAPPTRRGRPWPIARRSHPVSGSTPSRPTWPTRRRRARCCRRWWPRFGSVDAVVNNASLFEHDTRAELRLRQPAGAHCCANTGGTGAAGAGAACAPGRARRRRRGGQPAGPEAVEPESGLLQLHAVEGRAGGGHHAAGAGAGAAAAGGGRGARPHAHQPPAVAGEVRAAAQAVAAGPLVHARTTWRRRCASRWRTARSPAPRCWSTAAST